MSSPALCFHIDVWSGGRHRTLWCVVQGRCCMPCNAMAEWSSVLPEAPE